MEITPKLYRIFTFIFFSCVIFLTAYLLFYQLGTAKLDNWDEAWYGQMTKEMLSSKDSLLLHWNYSYLFDKPPFQIWLNLIIVLLLGFSEFSIRLVSALSGLVIILLVTIYSYKRWGLFSAFFVYITLTFNNVFIWRARSGNLDLLATLLILLSFFILLIKDKKKKYILLGLVFALLFLTKAALVMLPIAIFIIHELFFEIKNLRENKYEYIKLLLIFFSITGIWLLGGYLRAGNEFISYYLFKSDQGMGRISISNFKLNYINYAYYSLQRRFFFLYIVGIILIIKKLKKPEYFLLFLYSIVLLCILSFTPRSNNWYLIPAMPFWSLIIGYGVFQLINIFKFFLKKYYFLPLIPMLLISSYIAFRTLTINIMPILSTNASYSQFESGRMIEKLSKPEDLIVRLDTLYPTTLYYSNRKIISAPVQILGSGGVFISRNDLRIDINNKKIKWLVGTTSDIENFIKDNPNVSFQLIKVNSVEAIARVRNN